MSSKMNTLRRIAITLSGLWFGAMFFYAIAADKGLGTIALFGFVFLVFVLTANQNSLPDTNKNPTDKEEQNG